jgi:hypothetical protein
LFDLFLDDVLAYLLQTVYCIFLVSPPFSSGILLFLFGRGGQSFSAPKFQVAINVLPELVLALSALHLGKMLRWARDEMISDGDTMGYPLVILNINI